MRQRQWLGGPSEELLELEIEADISVVHRQTPDRRAREHSRRARKPPKEPRGTFGRERRVTREQLVRAVASEHHLDLIPREPAEQMGRQDRGVSERFIEPTR